MLYNDKILKIDIILALSRSLDLISPFLVGHHMRVAYTALIIGLKLGLNRRSIQDLIIAALLHDAGALSLKERMDTLDFDVKNPNLHADIGSCLLERHSDFDKVAEIIKYHHVSWVERDIYDSLGIDIPIESYILHAADRVDVLIGKENITNDKVNKLILKMKEEKGRKFNPIVIDAFFDSIDEYLNLYKFQDESLVTIFEGYLMDIFLNLDELIEITKIFESVIDFRSRFTATHSSGVSYTAVALSKLIGLSKRHIKLMRVAGQLHDIGKLGISGHILEKPGKLSTEEMKIMRNHALYSYNVLSSVRDFDVIPEWAAFHHEKLNGKGYPFRKTANELCLESRIMAIADIFTAITEDRPYRRGMDKDSALKVLLNMVKRNEIDKDIVSLLIENYEEVDYIRKEAQQGAVREFEEFSLKSEKFEIC